MLSRPHDALLSDPRILIVDDESLIRMDLRAILEEAGYTAITEAGDVDTALAVLQRGLIDIVLLDINLAGNAEGFEVAAFVRQATRARLIFVTGYNTRETRTRALAFAPAAIIAKPFTAGDVLAVVARAAT